MKNIKNNKFDLNSILATKTCVQSTILQYKGFLIIFYRIHWCGTFTVGCDTQLEIFALHKLFPFLIYFQTVFMMNFFVIFDDSSELNLNCTCCSRCCCHCCCRCCFRNIFFKFFKTFISWSWRDKDIGTYNFVFLQKHWNVPYILILKKKMLAETKKKNWRIQIRKYRCHLKHCGNEKYISHLQKL